MNSTESTHQSQRPIKKRIALRWFGMWVALLFGCGLMLLVLWPFSGGLVGTFLYMFAILAALGALLGGGHVLARRLLGRHANKPERLMLSAIAREGTVGTWIAVILSAVLPALYVISFGIGELLSVAVGEVGYGAVIGFGVIAGPFMTAPVIVPPFTLCACMVGGRTTLMCAGLIPFGVAIVIGYAAAISGSGHELGIPVCLVFGALVPIVIACVARPMQVNIESLTACFECGYDLSGVVGTQCPECGADMPAHLISVDVAIVTAENVTA